MSDEIEDLGALELEFDPAPLPLGAEPRRPRRKRGPAKGKPLSHGKQSGARSGLSARAKEILQRLRTEQP